MSNIKNLPDYPKLYRVLELCSQGYTNSEIGVFLEKSPATVRNQLVGMYRKYGAKNKAHLVRLAFEAGIL